MTRLVLMGVLVSLVLIAVMAVLIRTRRLQERYAMLWLAAALGVVVLGLWTDALELLASAVGIAYPPSALFMVVAAFLVAVLLDLAIVVSRLVARLHTLAQSHALLEERVQRMSAQLAERGEEEEPGEPVAQSPSAEERRRA